MHLKYLAYNVEIQKSIISHEYIYFGKKRDFGMF